MAELAIPLIALGSMYIMSNHKKKEAFTNMQIQNTLPNINPPVPSINYPINIKETSINDFMSPTPGSDKYFGCNQSIHQPGTCSPLVSSENYNQSNQSNQSNQPFTHNNQVPYFGSKIRGPDITRLSDNILDSMQGKGSQFISKTEQAPLFAPHKSIQYANGAPSTTDFIQSRVNPSLRMANVKPWDEKRVAPGLNMGYNTTAGNGFNSGMESRESWMDKNVDQLRTLTKPKQTFGLDGHEGPGISYIKSAPDTRTQGKVEKYLPDKYYESGQGHLFTTTGAEKAPTARSITLLNDVNRTNTSQEYYGATVNKTGITPLTNTYQPCNRIENPESSAAYSNVGGVAGRVGPTTGDYGIQGYNNTPTNRTSVNSGGFIGQINGVIKAVISPILDIMRPTRKEDIVNAPRFGGNATAPIYSTNQNNQSDRTKTTIREMYESALDCNHLNVQGQKITSHINAEHQPVNVQRDTTNISHTGGAGPGLGVSANKSYEAEYNQHNNVNKTYENRTNQGGTQMFNHQDNISIKRQDSDRDNTRLYVPSSKNIGGLDASTAVNNTRVKVTTFYDQNVNTDRISPEILKAFKDNPYTKAQRGWT